MSKAAEDHFECIFHLTLCRSIFEKSLAVNKDLPKNHILQFEDLESKKPKGCGINASRFEEIIGQKLKKPLRSSG